MSNRYSRLIISDVNPKMGGVYWFDTKNNELNFNGRCLIKNKNNMANTTEYPFITMEQLDMVPKARLASVNETEMYGDMNMTVFGYCFAIDICQGKLPTMVDISAALNCGNNNPIVVQLPWFVVKGPNGDDVAFCSINVKDNVFMFAYKRSSSVVFCCVKDNVDNNNK